MTDFTGRYIQVQGIRSFIEDWGSGQPILCIHTAGQSGVQYRRAAPALAALGYRVIVPDLPGHGRTEPHPDGAVTDLGVYAQWCVDMLGELGIVQPIVVGCSIGGKITLDIAARLGRRLHAGIAMAASAAPGRVNVNGLRRELEDVSAPSRSDRTYYGTRAVVGSSLTEEQRDLIALMHCREDPTVSNSDLIGWGTHDLRPVLAQIAAPLHLVLGSDDLWVTRDLAESTVAAVTGAELTYLDGVGHYPMEEMPDFADFVHDWLVANRLSTVSREAHVGNAI